MTALIQNLRYGSRLLRKSPGFTAVAVLTLALGIGGNTAVFSLVDGILLRALPYQHPEHLVSMTGTYPRGAFVAMREQMRTMDVATYSEGHDFNLTGMGEPVRLAGTPVSAELFSILGVKPQLGRTFLPGEDAAGQDNFVILSHSLWKEQFANDPSIVGRSIQLEGVSRQVLGVMPADFRFPSPKTLLWIPLGNDPRDQAAYWAGDFMPVIGRLRPGSTLQQARAEIKLFQSRVGALFPWPMPANWNADISVLPLRNGMVSDVRERLLMLLAAVAVVLLIACANVANLTLSRAATREKEMSIRSALGADRGRIVSQLLTESILLASLGGLLGLGFATAGLSLLKASLPPDTPRLADVYIDWRVLMFSGALAILTGFIFGIAPALQTSRSALTRALNSGGRGNSMSVSQRLRNSLAVAEVAFAVLLVSAAGLLIRSFWRLSHLDPGFRPEHVVTARITPNESFCNDTARCLAFYQSVLDQVRGAPGVSTAALVNTLPLSGRVAKRSLEIEDLTPQPGQDSPLFWLDVATPDYLRVMGIPLISGRWFNDADASGNPPVAVVTAASARKFWPGQNAVGKHIRFVGETEWRTVVGVVSNVRAYDMQRDLPDYMRGTLYVPQSPKGTLEGERLPAEMTIVLRTTTDEAQTADLLRRTVTTLNQAAPVSEVKTMDEVMSEAVSTPASTTTLFVTFAGLAMVLGVIGIYGVLSFLVSKRTREIGIRFALGAQRRDVLWLVMKEGAKFSVTGIALGLVAAFAGTRWLASELYGVSPMDPFTYAGVTIVMALATLLACYVPTRRAMRVDPLIALRFE
jgi:putative ABC transport system permease protein